jgi:UDP-glucose 4-epimerase
MRIFITGSSSGLAAALLPRLCARNDITAVVGLDLRPTPFVHPKFTFHQGNMCEPGLEQTMQGCDAVVHTGFAILQGRLSDAERYANNVDGTLHVFKAARAAGARRTINISSVSVYGAGEELNEDTPLNPSPLFSYACQKARIEQIAQANFPEVIHLRSHLIFGPNCQPLLRQFCCSRLCILPPKPWPRLQMVHEDDVVDAVLRCLDRPDIQGAFNLAASEEAVVVKQVVAKRW